MKKIAVMLMNKDIQIFLRLNRIKISFLDLLMKIITELGGLYLTSFYCVFIYLFISKQTGLLAGGISLTTSIIIQLIKRIINRPRPYYTFDNIKCLSEPLENYSFPSGHTAATFNLAIIFSRTFPLLAPLFFIIALLVAFSRVYLGVHYPSDVISGALIAILITNFILKILL
ncbi:MAG: phosphatase PAP2 family protein [Bacillota bacterium]